eukprot:4861510-Alexandrium_andersonii.AAC.1
MELPVDLLPDHPDPLAGPPPDPQRAILHLVALLLRHRRRWLPQHVLRCRRWFRRCRWPLLRIRLRLG